MFSLHPGWTKEGGMINVFEVYTIYWRQFRGAQDTTRKERNDTPPSPAPHINQEENPQIRGKKAQMQKYP